MSFNYLAPFVLSSVHMFTKLVYSSTSDWRGGFEKENKINALYVVFFSNYKKIKNRRWISSHLFLSETKGNNKKKIIIGLYYKT